MTANLTVADLCQFLETFAPSSLAAEWDNVGLLVGDRQQKLDRVITCLTVTPAVAAEAIRERADCVVTHHPLPFRPLKRLTTDETAGRLLLDLIRSGIAVYSPHTAFDSAATGINQQLADGLGLVAVQPLVPAESLGTGRIGRFDQAQSLGQVAVRLKQFLKIGGLHVVGDVRRTIERVAIACGSAGDLLDSAIAAGCDLFVTGEARLHTCYEAESSKIAMILAGHYASERFGVERLADVLAAQFPSVTIWASRDERDPMCWL
jgi:dinuclear metal center YbgI/SA1388 family protein